MFFSISLYVVCVLRGTSKLAVLRGVHFWRTQSYVLRFLVIFENALISSSHLPFFFAISHHLGGLFGGLWSSFGAFLVPLSFRFSLLLFVLPFARRAVCELSLLLFVVLWHLRERFRTAFKTIQGIFLS